MSTLYLEHANFQISSESLHLRLRSSAGDCSTLPLEMLERVVIRARQQLDSATLGKLAEAGIAVTILSNRGHRRRAIVLGRGGQDARRRLWQYRVVDNQVQSTPIARQLLQAKLNACVEGIDEILDYRPDQRRQLLRSRKTIVSMRQGMSAGDRDTMLGLEGAAARAWFTALASVLPPIWHFEGRNRRPPRDPVNAALSLAYTLLHADACSIAWATGLDPMLGFLHEPAHGRESLACDLIEPLRPRVDLALWRSFAERDFRQHHFGNTNQGCHLTGSGRKMFYPLWESMATPWRRYLRLGCMKLVRELERIGQARP